VLLNTKHSFDYRQGRERKAPLVYKLFISLIYGKYGRDLHGYYGRDLLLSYLGRDPLLCYPDFSLNRSIASILDLRKEEQCQVSSKVLSSLEKGGLALPPSSFLVFLGSLVFQLGNPAIEI
ncbi:unnamed protein product, partial (mitochondrion) [Musa textilis]